MTTISGDDFTTEHEAPSRYTEQELIAHGYVRRAHYDYLAIDGAPLYAIRRFEHPNVPGDKQFRMGCDDGDWLTPYTGNVRVPYRWPELRVADPEKTVFWCEGEKDVETCESHGLVATTAAGQKLSMVIAKALAGRNVVVLVDNDSKGEENAARAVAAFRHYAASLRVLRLPDLPRTEDVTYWFNNGGTVEDLMRLAAEEPCVITEERRGAIRASRFALCGDDEIPWPDYVYGSSYIRGTLSVTASAGGLGKSALLLTEALAMTTGKPLLGPASQSPLRVWYINLEDGDNVLVPRLKAAAKFHGITNADIGDRLFVDNSQMKLILASEDERRRAALNPAAITHIIREVKANRFDVVMIDPLVSAHQISENDNSAVDLVAKGLARIARETNCSLMVSHHMTKGQEARTADNVRGASALVNAARVVRVLNAMTAEEAERANVNPERRGFYFRMDDGKTNLAPAESSTWFERVNYDEFSFDDARKNVVVLKPFAFTAPEAAARLANLTQMDVAAAFAVGGPWRFDRQARSGWAGEQLALSLGIGAETKAEKDMLQRAIRSAVQRGWLSVVRAPDAQRKPREWVRLADGAPPSEGDAQNEGGANC
ncbi:AAA family ATPase [Bradyrhizobium sp. USDA 313]|uniref:AAA family ATPase n=1 Tax=Bradyrhizobium sp. USDA 313 TaxID=3156307 RepID=UPI003512965F